MFKMDDIIKIIEKIAAVPSFSSYEDRLHPLMNELLEKVPGSELYHVPDNNLVAAVPGNRDVKPVALTAHLDKINHFGESPPDRLPFHDDGTRVTGQMDNTAGLAICIWLAILAEKRSFPPLYLLFSEMEESYGLKHHPHLLKNDGKGLHHGIGAERISRFLISENMLPQAVITVDTTPLFKEKKGVALYSEHWNFTGCEPGDPEKKRTDVVRNQLTEIDPDLFVSNNTNDYLHYGAELNRDKSAGIPSLAIEPAIYPYHTINEAVHLEDIARVIRILERWLERTE